jgi:hypothetical protein
MGIQHKNYVVGMPSKHSHSNINLSPYTDKVLVPKVAPAKIRGKGGRLRGTRPPMWKRGAGVGNRAVWDGSIEQYVVR